MVARGDVVLQAGGWELFVLAEDRQGGSVSCVTAVGSAGDPKAVLSSSLCCETVLDVGPAKLLALVCKRALHVEVWEQKGSAVVLYPSLTTLNSFLLPS